MFVRRSSSLDEMENHKASNTQINGLNGSSQATISSGLLSVEKSNSTHKQICHSRSTEDISENHSVLDKSNTSHLTLSVQATQSPKLRNRFSWNTPMSSLRKKINRRSLHTIDDDVEESSASPTKTSSSSNVEDVELSTESLPHSSPIVTPGSSDSVFDSPTGSIPNSATSGGHANGQSVGLTIPNMQKMSRNTFSDTIVTANRSDKTKAGTFFSPSRFLEEFSPKPGSWSPAALRRGSAPVLPQKLPPGLSRQRSGVVKMKVS